MIDWGGSGGQPTTQLVDQLGGGWRTKIPKKWPQKYASTMEFHVKDENFVN
jgi:hypothetical protein